MIDDQRFSSEKKVCSNSKNRVKKVKIMSSIADAERSDIKIILHNDEALESEDNCSYPKISHSD